jgi:hypothetical protein
MQSQPPDLFDIIHFETPQIQKFYDDALKHSHHTPQKSFRILPILASPFEFKLNIRKSDTHDLFNELLEQENRLKSPFSSQRPANFSYNISQVFFTEMRRLQFLEKGRGSMPIEPEKSMVKQSDPEPFEKKSIETTDLLKKPEDAQANLGNICPN